MHPDESLELYALGDLDEQERREIERHVAGCAACARRLAAAGEVIADLAGLLPDAGQPVRAAATPRSPWRTATLLAVAATFVFALISGVLLLRLDAQRAEIARLQAPQIAMASGHFAHVQLRATSGAGPGGKVIFNLDRRWIYVLVDARGPYRLWIQRNGRWDDGGAMLGDPAFAVVRGGADAVAVSAADAPQTEAILRAQIPRAALHAIP
ncbi:MAG: zf-HC2 domain-containing protein [bacterium]|nr:zf-HC2 domain-containing protein [bacterium]